MTHCIARNRYIPLGSKNLVTFPEENLLAWVQNHWLTDQTLIDGIRASKDDGFWIEDDDVRNALMEEVKKIFSPYPSSNYWFYECFITIIRTMGEVVNPPQTEDDLEVFLLKVSTHYYDEDWECSVQNNAIQGCSFNYFERCYTLWSIFDDKFAINNNEITSFLLHPENTLPQRTISSLKDIQEPFHTLNPNVQSSSMRSILVLNVDLNVYDFQHRVYGINGENLDSLLDWLRSLKEIPDDANRHWRDEIILLRACAFYKPKLRLLDLLIWMGTKGLFTTPRTDDYGLRNICEYHLKDKPRLLEGDRESCLAEMELFLAKRKELEKTEPPRPPVEIESNGNALWIQFGCGHEDPNNIECQNHSWILFDQSWIENNVDLANSIMRFGNMKEMLFEGSERLKFDREKYLSYNGGKNLPDDWTDCPYYTGMRN